MPFTFRCIQRDSELPAIMRLIEQDLSEPYSIYTYRYFTHNYPHLCILAHHPTHATDNGTDERTEGKLAGVIIGRIDEHKRGLRGYIAMLAVAPPFRRLGLATELVSRLLDVLHHEAQVVEVVLEAEENNAAALKLYERLGFVRDKWLPNYYLCGSHAFRLKLYMQS